MLRRLFGGDHSPLDGFLPDAFAVQTGAIIADFDVDLPALMESAQNQASGGVFPGFHAVVGKLDAMVHGVAYQVREGSLIASMMVLSSSVSLPSISMATSL